MPLSFIYLKLLKIIKQKHNRAQEHFISQNEYVFFFFFFLIAIQYISLSVIPTSIGVWPIQFKFTLMN